eukprot:TRINITY_DN1030_c0_g1_i1.p1 TRINITY_DN1030_c0_g1~~TRINITY_DN1030_c0_g1_i1.p1  ORF type:complete len:504 (+),score=133.12 TRINITY_DN1030_c0_g1_i1:61-1572(+)
MPRRSKRNAKEAESSSEAEEEVVAEINEDELEDLDMELDITVHVALGTYEHMLHGIDCNIIAAKEGDETIVAAQMKKVYVSEPHAGPITAIKSVGGTLVSGSTDELMQVLDLHKKTESGTLLLHEATITALAFHDQVNMLSAAEDGTIAVWDAQSWDHLKVLRGHKGAVNDIAIHPSGKFCLSVGRDRSLRIWDTMKGRCAYITKRPREPTVVIFLPQGDYYIVGADRQLMAYSVATNELLFTTSMPFRINAVVAISDTHVAVCGYGDTIYIINVPGRMCTSFFKAHDKRIKAMTAQRLPLGNHVVLFTSDATGSVKAWHVDEAFLQSDESANADNSEPKADDGEQAEKDVADDEPVDLELEPLTELTIRSRVTCMTSTDKAKRNTAIKSVMQQANTLISSDQLEAAANKSDESLVKRTRVGPKPKKIKPAKEFQTVQASTTENQAEAAMTEGLPAPRSVVQASAEDQAIAINKAATTQARASTSKKKKGKKKGKGKGKPGIS